MIGLKRLTRGAGLVAAAMTGALVAGSPAGATAISGSPASGDGDVKPFAIYCEPGTWVYSMTNTTNTFDAKYRTSVINSTSSYVNYKFTATKTGTTTFTVSLSVTAELKAAIFAKMQATVNAGIEQTNTTAYGAEVSGQVKPKSTLHGDYGNWRENVSWKSHYVYSNCNSTSEKSGTAYAPYREAWKLYY